MGEKEGRGLHLSVRLGVVPSPTVSERVPDEESLGVDTHSD